MRSPSFRTRRLLLVALAAASAIFLIVMAGSNVMLSGRLLRSQLQGGQDDFFVDYASASSPWPGVVSLKGLILRDRDGSTEWAFQAEEIRFRFSLLALARKRLSVRAVSGRGLSFRARSQPEPGTKAPDSKLLPSIPGFPRAPAPAQPESGTPKPPGSPWTIRVEGIDLPLREIWVNAVSWQGSGRLRGRFELDPGRRAEAGPATVEFSDGVLKSGANMIAAKTSGRVEGKIPSWDVERYPGDKVFEIAQGQIRLRGDLGGLEFLAGGFPGAGLRGGRGSIALALDHTKGKGQGSLDVVARGGRARIRGRAVAGDLEGALRLHNVDIAKGDAVLSGSRLRLERVSVEGSERTDPWWARLVFPEARYIGHPPRVSFRLEGTLRDARPVLALAAGLPDWAAKGLSEREVRVRLRARAGAGLVDLLEIEAIASDLSIHGRYWSRGDSERGVFLVDAGLLNVGFAVGGEKPGLKVFGPRSWYEKALAEWDKSGNNDSGR